MTDGLTPFERAEVELRRLGLKLGRLPGEFCVNYLNAGPATAQVVETLDEALEVGRAMAAARPEPTRFSRRFYKKRRGISGKSRRRWRRAKPARDTTRP